MLFMAFFKKKGRVVDLSEKYHSQQEQLNDMRSEIVEEKSQESPPSGNGIFNMLILYTKKIQFSLKRY